MSKKPKSKYVSEERRIDNKEKYLKEIDKCFTYSDRFEPEEE